MGLKENQPIFLQIADWLIEEIVGGRYLPDERVPSVRECAAISQVNANTVVRSYEYLENLGIIYNRRGLGYFVATDAVDKIVEKRRHEFFSTEMTYMFSRLRSMGMTPDDLVKYYTDYLNNN